jgi:hypothetical protein
VFRTRADALKANECPAYLMYPAQETSQRVSPATVQRTLTLRFEAITAGRPPQDQALDPLLSYVPLTLWADATFRGLVQGLLDAKIVWNSKTARRTSRSPRSISRSRT